MAERPATAAGHRGEHIARVRATCLYAATKLRDLMDDLGREVEVVATRRGRALPAPLLHPANSEDWENHWIPRVKQVVDSVQCDSGNDFLAMSPFF